MLVLFSSFLLPPPRWYADHMEPQGEGSRQVWDVRQDAAFWALIKRALAHPDTLTRKRAMHLLLRALPSEHQISALASRASASARTAPTEPTSKDTGSNAGSLTTCAREEGEAHSGQAGSRKDGLPPSDQDPKGKKPKDRKKSKRERWAREESQGQLGQPNRNGAAPEGPGQDSLLAHVRAVCRRWNAFCLLLDTLDEFGLHLAEAVWQPQVRPREMEEPVSRTSSTGIPCLYHLLMMPD